tara:strand:+ start:441 stop:1040 length:600 start_codon:yes stop_codon:yes gene_type:complete
MLEIEYKNTDELIPYINNSRIHSEEQVTQVASSIKEFGFTNPILIDGENGIIAGHGRLLAAKKLGIKEIPTIMLEGLTEYQKRAYVIADNKLALNSGWDFDLLKLEFEDLTLNIDLELLGFSQIELEAILQDEMDMSILDDLEESEIDDLQANVKKAIQIEFEAEHYEEAQELVKFWREKEAYIGYMIIQYLKSEKEKL